MTVSLASTSRKYHGRKAETYEAVRTKQLRWRLENEVVEQMLLDIGPKTVLDVPVGTGRFFEVYRKLQATVTAVDISDEMLALARKRLRRGDNINLVQRGIEDIAGDTYDAAVCVRFLDLIDERAMQMSVKKLCGAARHVIATIRLGDKYVPKSNTAEHDKKKFTTMIKRLGFAVEQVHPIFNAGWTVVKLGRAK